ncbi:toprim domain-containing protein [Pseudoruegeria sp. SHC-113]|uniref:toprim domain-containing protein n=1 Tax=Pseudoruegeria sp. SHC-113 TaxID=2855439 RepID=UPI0021BB081E|nr:toprim domain-containing protein [Pseudoruegeria sp. SHC-113]
MRFDPACWHGPSQSFHPAIVAKVSCARGFAIHRTFILADGSCKARVSPQRLALGSTGGGSVFIAAGTGRLVVAEGIETALSLNCGLLDDSPTIWAALSSAGLVALELPSEPGVLTIATDGDEAGEVAGEKLAKRARGLGWNVSILSAPKGRDWNDILMLAQRRLEMANIQGGGF